MTRLKPTILAIALLMVVTSACKRSQTEEPGAAAEEPAATAAVEQVAEEAEGPSEQPGATVAAESGSGEAETGNGRSIESIPVPADWSKASAKSPKGVTVSLGVPAGWVELPPPNPSTLLVRGAPYKIVAGGTKVSVVAVELEGGRDALADYAKRRLAGFSSATLEREGPVRVGSINGYEMVTRWPTPSGEIDTVQLLVATGQEAIGVSCQLLPDTLATLAGLCDEIFATLLIEGPAKAKP